MEKILKRFADRLYELCKDFGFSKPVIRSNVYVANIYVVSKYAKELAIEIQIEWRDKLLEMFVVYMKEEVFPPDTVIYHYDDGQWCRKSFEEIYCTKSPSMTKKEFWEKSLLECLDDGFDFYANLIKSNPDILRSFLKSNFKFDSDGGEKS